MIGEGGASKVYLAEQVNIQRKCAIKCVSKGHQAFGQLKQEFMLLKQFEHVGIPRIYDVEEDGNNLYIIEEYVCGETLDKFIVGNPITEKEALDITLQICNIIEYLHSINKEPIVYQDLKPNNIMVGKNGLIKLIDFGSAMTKSDLQNQIVRGVTHDYAAPELYSNSNIDHRADIYSIGKIIEYIINYNLVNISKSVYLNQITKGCLGKSPTDRFPNIKSIISVINSGLSNENTRKKICVIGAQRRVGTTYVSIVIAKALERKGYRVLLREENTCASLDHLLERNKIKVTDDLTYKIRGIHIQPTSMDNMRIDQYQYIVEDCGEVDYDQIPQAELYVLVMGTREWELCYTEKLIVKLNDIKNTVYWFNLSANNIYKQIKNTLHRKKCMQVPYIMDPFKVEMGVVKMIMEGLSL